MTCRLDGRRLRLDRDVDKAHKGIAYHRPAQEDMRSGAAGSAPSSMEKLPKSSGQRWIPVSPLAPRDGGLELFVTDGELAAALTKRGIGISERVQRARARSIRRSRNRIAFPRRSGLRRLERRGGVRRAHRRRRQQPLAASGRRRLEAPGPADGFRSLRP